MTAFSLLIRGIFLTSPTSSKIEGTLTAKVPVPVVINPAGITLLFCEIAL